MCNENREYKQQSTHDVRNSKKNSEKSTLIDIEFDIVVRVPPVKEQTILVRVKSIEKAIPHVVEPEKVSC